jgi:hypothetical protein
VRKETKYVADNMKAGMTAGEIEAVVKRAPKDSVPKVTISLSGKVQTIKIEDPRENS